MDTDPLAAAALALQRAGLAVERITIPNMEDTATWVFEPALNRGQRALAIVIVYQLLNPPTVPGTA